LWSRKARGIGDKMNGPGTSNLTTGSARPGWGLPFQQLPAATQRDLTPESMLNEQIQTGRQRIQDKYALQWQEINRSKRFIGAVKAQQMLRQIDMKAKQEMLQFNQQAQQQLAQLQNIDRLAQQGAITNPEEIKARVTFGADVARSMYPTQKKERPVPQQFGELDVYSHRISQELENFRLVGKRIPKLFERRGKLGWPLPKEKERQELQIWDPTIPAKDPKTDEDIMGNWRKAEPEEIGIYGAWLQEEKDIAKRKRELLGMPDIARRIVQPGTKGGTFSDKVTESIKPQRVPTVTKPKVIRQRNRRTGKERISYDGGKTWQTIG